MKLFIFLVSLLHACSLHSTDSDMITNPDASKSAYTFLSLGDSYTIGESVEASDRWSVQLAGMLRKNGVDVGDPDIIARTGWTTAELQKAIKATGNQKVYSCVSLMIGVNNQYRGQSQNRYRSKFQELLQTSIKFAGGKPEHVFVLSIPDWGVAPYAEGRNRRQIGADIDAFNAIAQEECRKSGIAYVDVTLLSRQAAGKSDQFAADGLHYSGKQMRLWAEAALPIAQALVKK